MSRPRNCDRPVNPPLTGDVRRVDLPPSMAVEVVAHKKSKEPHVNFRMLQLRVGNRTLWTWALLTPAKAREIAAQLLAAADEVEGR